MKLLIRSGALLVLLCCLVITTVGCSSDSNLSAKTIANEIKSYSADTISWQELSATQLSSYFGFTDENVDEYTVYVNGADDHFDIIAAVRPAQSEDHSKIVEGFTFAVNNASANYKASNTTEYKKISSALIKEADGILILVALDSYDLVNAYLNEIGAKNP